MNARRPLTRARSGRRRSRMGQSLAEFSLILPIMLVLFAAGADFARIYFAGIEITDAARESALYASHHGVGQVGSTTCQGCNDTSASCVSYCNNQVLAYCTNHCEPQNNQVCTTFCYDGASNACQTFCYGQNNSTCKQYCWGSGTGGNNLCLTYCTPNDGQCTSVCTWDGVSTPDAGTLVAVANASGNSPFRCPHYTVTVQNPIAGPVGTTEQAVTLVCSMPLLTDFLPFTNTVTLTATSTSLLPVNGP